VEEELLIVKTNFDYLEMIYKATSFGEIESCKPIYCENCEVLHNKVKYILKTA